MSRVLIAGCGYVGVAAADLFHAAGWEVEAWTRSENSAETMAHKPYRVRAVDISDRKQLQLATGPFDAVIHCASTRGGGVEAYRKVYLDGAKNLIELLRPRTFVFTSSTSVYAQTGGEWVDENSQAEPLTETGRILRETEEFVRQAGGIIARVGGVYGPGRSALLRKLLSGEAKIEGEGDRFINQAHRDDIAAAFLLLLNLPNEQRTAPPVFNVVDDQPMTQLECYQWLATKLGQPMPPSASAPTARKRGSSNKRVSNRKLRALGWQLRFPTFIAGMENSVLPAAVEAMEF